MILYRGPSCFDPDRTIQVIITGDDRKSKNRKTGGGMLQSWILDTETDPVEAVDSGLDDSYCGSCPLGPGAPAGKRVCYVVPCQAPMAVWKKADRNGYDLASWPQFYLKSMRLGSYGDPAAVPDVVWRKTTMNLSRWTGYTHSWRTTEQSRAEYLMASCDSREDRTEAKSKGWRTFRVLREHEEKEIGEIYCPASLGKTTCDSCHLCQGTMRNGPDIAIKAHGNGKSNLR